MATCRLGRRGEGAVMTGEAGKQARGGGWGGDGWVGKGEDRRGDVIGGGVVGEQSGRGASLGRVFSFSFILIYIF